MRDRRITGLEDPPDLWDPGASNPDYGLVQRPGARGSCTELADAAESRPAYRDGWTPRQLSYLAQLAVQAKLSPQQILQILSGPPGGFEAALYPRLTPTDLAHLGFALLGPRHQAGQLLVQGQDSVALVYPLPFASTAYTLSVALQRDNSQGPLGDLVTWGWDAATVQSIQLYFSAPYTGIVMWRVEMNP